MLRILCYHETCLVPALPSQEEEEMPFGWAGVSLNVDLTTGKIEKKVRSSELNDSFLGGKGTNVKLFWDRVPPETSPFSPENLLIFGAGLLTGTFAPAANRAVVTTISPATDLLTYSSLGGFWAAELKYAGYDDIIISGKSPTPVYLWIKDNEVEIRDARHLWGKDTIDTKKHLREELKNNRVQILCVGPAGENRAYMASIEHDFGSSASRTGVGAVMGDKKLKAIAVCGTKDIHIARPSEFLASCEGILKKIDKVMAFVDDYSHKRIATHISGGLFGNLGKSMPWPEAGDVHADFLQKTRTGRPSCSNCPVNCKSSIQLPEGGQSYLKCLSWVIFVVCCKIPDFMFSVKCYRLCERYGLDSISTARILGFAMDLYERGILTRGDTGGASLEFGNEDSALSLIESIAHRTGIGAILADGVYKAAQQIGRGAEEYTYHVKKLEAPPYALYLPYSAYKIAFSDRADLLKQTSAFLLQILGTSKESKEAYLKSGFFPYPEEFEKYIWETIDYTGSDYERQSRFVSYDTDKVTIADCTGTCTYWTGHWLHPPIQLADMANLVSAATGIEFDENEAVKVAKRVGHILRAYNVILGLRRQDDSVPDKFFRDPPLPPRLTLNRERFDRTVREYYKLRGWDGEGIPGGEELDELGLNDVRRELERRGLS